MTGVVLIGGPTASGKSGLALALAEDFGGVVINADAMQVYRELAILTARPGAEALARAPHRLYGAISIADPWSVGRWRARALDEIAAARAAGRLAIVTGGSGLYLRALTQGLAPVPDVPEVIRADAEARRTALGARAFHAALAARDPATAAGLHPGDAQRTVRAWAVIEATGVPLAEWRRRGQAIVDLGPVLSLVLMPPRASLYARCDARLRAMLAAGALDEVAGLDRFASNRPGMKALGLRDLRAHLAGACDLATAIAAAQQATRRYAKRQCTWFRHQMPDAVEIGAEAADDGLRAATKTLRRFLLTLAK